MITIGSMSNKTVLRAASVGFCEDNGAAVGLSPRGTTRTTGNANWNWKNIDDSTSTYSDYAITAGNNSFSKYNWLAFSGSYNMITGVGYAHTGVSLGAGLQVRGFITGSGGYATPSTTTVATLIFDFTPTGLATSGVLVGAGAPELSGKDLSTTSNPAASQYIIHQLVTTAAASAGDSAQYFHYFTYTEN